MAVEEPIRKRQVAREGPVTISGVEQAPTFVIDGLSSILVTRDIVKLGFYENLPTGDGRKAARVTNFLAMDRTALRQLAAIIDDVLKPEGEPRTAIKEVFTDEDQPDGG